MYPVATQLICSITSIVTIGYITLLRGNLGLRPKRRKIALQIAGYKSDLEEGLPEPH